MVQLTIKVTKEILERSKMCGVTEPMISTNCAVALALRDIFPNVSVTSTQALIFSNDYGFLVPLPESAGRFVRLFDNTKPENRPRLPEIEFTIELPDMLVNRINIDEIRPLLVNHPTLTLIEA